MTWKESCIPDKTVKQSAKTTKLQISCEASAKPISFWKALQNIFWNVPTLIDTICCNKRLKTSIFFPYQNLLKWQRCCEISPGQRSRNTRKTVLRLARLWLSHNWHVLTLVIWTSINKINLKPIDILDSKKITYVDDVIASNKVLSAKALK